MAASSSVFPVRGKDRSARRVEVRIVLHHADGCLNRIERRASAIEHRGSSLHSLTQRLAIGLIAFRTQFRAVNDARAAVHDDGPVPGLWLLCHCQCSRQGGPRAAMCR